MTRLYQWKDKNDNNSLVGAVLIVPDFSRCPALTLRVLCPCDMRLGVARTGSFTRGSEREKGQKICDASGEVVGWLAEEWEDGREEGTELTAGGLMQTS